MCHQTRTLELITRPSDHPHTSASREAGASGMSRLKTLPTILPSSAQHYVLAQEVTQRRSGTLQMYRVAVIAAISPFIAQSKALWTKTSSQWYLHSAHFHGSQLPCIMCCINPDLIATTAPKLKIITYTGSSDLDSVTSGSLSSKKISPHAPCTQYSK